jgi:hypothetical protein
VLAVSRNGLVQNQYSTDIIILTCRLTKDLAEDHFLGKKIVIKEHMVETSACKKNKGYG